MPTTRIHVNGKDHPTLLRFQKIVHPDELSISLTPALTQIKKTLDEILERNTIAKATMRMSLAKKKIDGDELWVPKTDVITADLVFGWLYAPVWKKKGMYELKPQRDYHIPLEFSLRSLRKSPENVWVLWIDIRNKVYRLLDALLQKEEEALRDPVIKMETKYPWKPNNWAGIRDMQRQKISGVMERIWLNPLDNS